MNVWSRYRKKTTTRNGILNMVYYFGGMALLKGVCLITEPKLILT